MGKESNTRLADLFGLTGWALTLPYFGSEFMVSMALTCLMYVALSLPFTVFLLTGFFRSLPDELEEASAIDGAGPLSRIFRIATGRPANAVPVASCPM